MIRMEDECVGCPIDMGCLGSACPFKSVPRFYCDRCGEESKLYWWNHEQLCLTCIEEELERVEFDYEY